MQRVLVVEDSKVVQQVLRHLSSQYIHAEIDFAWSLKESQEYLNKNHYTLALVDLTLPDAHDGEVVELTLKEQVPTVVLTSKIDEYSRQQMLEAGVVDYVIKDNRDSYLYAVKLVSRLLRNQGCKALIADDSIISRRLMKQMLEKQLFTVIEAHDGQEALSTLTNDHDIKLLLTDYAMPTMDGFELVKKIRNSRGRDDLAIIGLSGADSHGLSAKFIKFGANDFLAKPFMNEEFHCRIMQTMDQLNLIAEIKEHAYKDFLTGLNNRRYFCMKAEKLFKTQPNQHMLALLDLDHFKSINDEFGHEGGDCILRQFADLLKSAFTSGEVARIGGEEFAVILSSQAIATAQQLMEEFRCMLAKTSFKFQHYMINCTVSIGIAPSGTGHLSEVMRKADKALYSAKAQQRNCVVSLP